MAIPNEDENRRGSHNPAADRFPDSEDLCGEVESYIRARPFKSVAIALLVGIIVGRILL